MADHRIELKLSRLYVLKTCVLKLSQMAEGGNYIEYEPAKYGSLLQHSFSTLMDDSEEDTISESRGSSQADLLDLRLRKSPRSSCISAKSIPKNNNIQPNGHFSEPTSPIVITKQEQSNPTSPRSPNQADSGTHPYIYKNEFSS